MSPPPESYYLTIPKQELKTLNRNLADTQQTTNAIAALKPIPSTLRTYAAHDIYIITLFKPRRLL